MALRTWTVLEGLSGDGPAPTHYHLGHPTPWSEGLVVRFASESCGEWVGNFQLGAGSGTAVVDWPEADGIVVLAGGSLYLLSASDPESYVTHHSNQVKRVLLDPESQMLLVLAEPEVSGYGTSRGVVWCAENLAYQIEFKSCKHGVLTLELQDDLDEQWRTVRLSVKTGAML
jgi:hypothetical protein